MIWNQIFKDFMCPPGDNKLSKNNHCGDEKVSFDALLSTTSQILYTLFYKWLALCFFLSFSWPTKKIVSFLPPDSGHCMLLGIG